MISVTVRGMWILSSHCILRLNDSQMKRYVIHSDIDDDDDQDEMT